MIIGINGYAQAGKDTIGDYLVREHGFVKFAFADKVRELAEAINPTLHSDRTLRHCLELCDGDWERVKSWDGVREFLVGLGQGCRDVLSEDIWVNQFLKWQIERLKQADTRPIVVTDMRFPNEYKMIVDGCDGQAWHVTRPGTVDTGVDDLLWNHRFHTHFRNDEDIERLEKSVEYAVNMLKASDEAVYG